MQAHLRVAHLSGRLLPEVQASAKATEAAQSCARPRSIPNPAAWRFGLF
jgi:hypothetical protein